MYNFPFQIGNPTVILPRRRGVDSLTMELISSFKAEWGSLVLWIVMVRENKLVSGTKTELLEANEGVKNISFYIIRSRYRIRNGLMRKPRLTDVG